MALRGYYSGEKNETDGEETKQRALKRRWFGGRSRETIFVWEKVWNHRAWGGINIPRLRIVLDVDGESRVRGKRRRRASGAEGTRGPWIRSFRVRAQCEPRSARVFVQLAKGGGLHFRARTLAVSLNRRFVRVSTYNRDLSLTRSMRLRNIQHRIVTERVSERRSVCFGVFPRFITRNRTARVSKPYTFRATAF